MTFSNLSKIACITASLFLTAAASAAVLRLPDIVSRVGETIEVPVIVEEVEGLAGVKLTVDYDASVLRFKTSEKTAQTESLLHVVNDRQPGRLIIVMAGPKGIKGKTVRLMTLTFTVTGLPKKPASELQISGVELMNAALKRIDCEPVQVPIRVLSK